MKKRGSLLRRFLILIMAAAVILPPAGLSVCAAQDSGASMTEEAEESYGAEQNADDSVSGTGEDLSGAQYTEDTAEDFAEDAADAGEEDGNEAKTEDEAETEDETETEEEAETEDETETEAENGDGQETEEIIETGVIYADRIADEQDLLSEYLEREKRNAAEQEAENPDTGGKTKLRAATRKLTGFNAEIYREALVQIRDVADGLRDSSVIEVPISSFLDRTRYTAGDLGVDTLFTVSQTASGKKIYTLTSRARQALYEQIGWSAGKVMDFLIVNCPYELYWYDKTVSYLHSLKDHTAADGGNVLVLDDAKIRLYLPVSGDYAADPDSEQAAGKTDAEKLCMVNTERTGAARKAVDRAKEIVAQAAGLSDWDKLVTYRDAVFDLASYNYEAAYVDSSYGDPYQLIYVFDGDPDTKVVCEGFSKAFQYLCDLTTWNREISCMTVTGNLGSGSSGVKHMWNVVRLWDGTAYAVDLTNSDKGTQGYPDKLFMVGAEDYDNGSYSLMNGSFNYTYDEDTRNVYTEESVALSSKDAHAPHYSPGQEPVLEWDLDNRTCSASLTCDLCDEPYELEAAMTVTDYPEKGYSLYTASVTIDGKVYTDERTFPLEKEDGRDDDDPDDEEDKEPDSKDPEKEDPEKENPEKENPDQKEDIEPDHGGEQEAEPDKGKTQNPDDKNKDSGDSDENEEKDDKGSPKVGDVSADRIRLLTAVIMLSITALAGAAALRR